MASNTPNLGLLKKDPVTDSNDTFNIKTMLNDNWDKIDSAMGNIKVPDASTAQKGIVQLSNATDGTRETVAATERAVGQAFQYGIERKNEVAAALNSIGVPASTSETWAELITKMASVIRATGNATTSDVLAGKTFSNGNANELTGSIPICGDEFKSGVWSNSAGVTFVNAEMSLSGGYYPPGTKARPQITDLNLIPSNIPKDTSIFGVKGLLERLSTTDRNAIVSAISSKGVWASSSDSNGVLADKIRQIQTLKYASGSVNASDGNVYVGGLAFRPKMVKMYGRYEDSSNPEFYIPCFLFDTPMYQMYGFRCPVVHEDGYGLSGFGEVIHDNAITSSGFSVKAYSWRYNSIKWEAWGN
ncbi:phage tail protein [Paenibacillus sp.]|jgi:hypothetical protein|uniref:phage tail protein n=1 Tax=Paenibacillus sp. TaxID=58172 RepID=UPI00283922BB|nr:phage tail protein [Paenibacillus sp.]MDR0268360.1 phage tail protein [Paenibacillus sp.]